MSFKREWKMTRIHQHRGKIVIFWEGKYWNFKSTYYPT